MVGVLFSEEARKKSSGSIETSGVPCVSIGEGGLGIEKRKSMGG